MVNWDDYRIFLAVARNASVRKAAGALGVSHSTVLRRISALEGNLGVRLFERLPTGYFTTPAGEDLLGSAQRIEEEEAAASRRIVGRDSRLSGKIRVTMPDALVTHLLMPDLAEFSRLHPDIELEVIPTYAVADLAKREADVAIRLSNDPPDDLVGRRLLSLAKAAYVRKDFLPSASGKAEMPALKWIGWPGDTPSPQWIEDSDFPDLPTGVRIGDPLAQVAAVKAGLGMALLPCFMADVEPDLCRMPPGSLQQYKDIWVLTHKDLRNTARIRKFTGFIAQALLRQRDLLEGRCPRSLPSVVTTAA